MKFLRRDSSVHIFILALSQTVGGATLAGQSAATESPARPAVSNTVDAPMPVPAPAIPVPPTMKSPVDFFRELLDMSPGQRTQALTNRPPETRKLILAKVREYRSLNADERELRLKATELEWRLVPLMKTSPTNRAALLAALSEDDRKMVEARLKEWDKLPEPVKKDLLDRRESIRLYIQMTSGSTISTNIHIPLRPKIQEDLKKLQTLSDPERQKLIDRFNQYFDFDPREREKVLRTLTSAEKDQIEKTLSKFEGLSRGQRAQCIRSFEQFANMNVAERQQFLKNAEHWIMMTPKKRQEWRDLVEKVFLTPTPPTFVNVPKPPPPAPRPSAQPALTTNGGGN